MRPGVDSASKNEYQGFPWCEGGRCVRLTTYHPFSAERQEIQSRNLPGTPVGLLGLQVGVTFTFTFLHCT
jgi:hypothetical protein